MKTPEEIIKNSEHDCQPTIILYKTQWHTVYNWMDEYASEKTKELQEQLSEKTEALENSENGMLNLIKYKNELVEQLAAKDKEVDSESQEDILHWVLHNYKPYEDGMSMVWRNINPDIDTLHTSKELHEIFKNRNK
jgi:predicted transcriptional regulator